MADEFNFDELSEAAPTESSDGGDDTVSFTLDDGGDQNVLELIKDDGDGNLFYRDNNEWVEVKKDDEMPGLYDKEMVDIDRPKIGEAIKLFDEGNDLTKADVASLLQVKQ